MTGLNQKLIKNSFFSTSNLFSGQKWNKSVGVKKWGKDGANPMHREYRQKQISQQNVMHQSRGSKTNVATKKSPNKNIGPSDNRNRISEVTRESYSEYSEA